MRVHDEQPGSPDSRSRLGVSRVSYLPARTSRASAQFNDLASRRDIDHALMYRLLQLVEAPWDAWPVQPGGGEPELRQAQSGERGLLSFRVDDQAESLIIFNIIWAG
jgi:hypothetical protein